jgi:SAM-dependent methyltransferase
MVFHQYHESKRDMDAAMKELQGSSYTAEGSRKMGGLYTVYNHGHRERATDGKLGGILGDHVARYKFAMMYSHDRVVLDCPCGTGYGREIVTNAKEYIGVDVDAESVLSARKKNQPNSRWLVSDMRATGVDDNHVDLLLCFEGVEHIDQQEKFVDEMYRVLRPGGTFIISTPQKGATGGTPWDRYILSAEELYSLFANDRWCKLDWFWQLNYADPAPPRQGTPPKNAAIMILGGTKK